MIFLTQPDNIETSGSEVPDSINTKASPAQPDKIETSAAASLVEALAKSEGSTISEKNKSMNCLSLSTNEEHAELEVEDHLEYRVNRMLGGKADAVKEQLDVVRTDSPLVPQQLNEKSFADFPLEVQTKVIKKFKNINFRYNVSCMKTKGLLDETEDGKWVLKQEVDNAFALVKEKLPKMKKPIATILRGFGNATRFPQPGEVDGPERCAAANQGLVLLKEAIDKLITFRNVQHANYEFVKLCKLYDKSKTMKKIEAQKQFIAELEEDIATWIKRKSLLQSSKDKDRRAVLSQKIDDAKKEIEGHNKKLAKLQEEESLRRSVRLQKTPRSTSKSPHTVPLSDESGRASKRQRTLSTAIDSEESTGDSSAAAPGESAPGESAPGGESAPTKISSAVQTTQF